MPAFISDLDRTLVYRPAMDEMYLEQVGRLGIDPDLARELWYRSHGVPMLMQLVELGASHSSAIAFCEDFFQQCEEIPAQSLPGARELLVSAREAGFLVAITTGSGQHLAQRTLQDTGLADLVDLTLGSEQDKLKGEDHMRILAEWIEPGSPRPFRSSWMIGDGAKDMQIASRHEVEHRVGVALPGIGGTSPDALLQSGASWVAAELGQISRALIRL